ncbi:MAG: iron ABC transporter permease [Alphaproteobacteria bacterium]|nr:iron ABC transporter permease [Alphaproteobacteria bacterium]
MMAVDRRRITVLGALGALVAALLLLGLSLGPAPVGLADILSGLLAVLGIDTGDAGQGAAIVQAIRVPRAALGLGVGAALGLSGAALQGLFRNPLVDPSLIGVSMGGALGAACAIVLAAGAAGGAATGFLGAGLTTGAAFAGSFTALVLVLTIARREGALCVATLLLAGLAINALAAAGLGALLFASDDAAMRAITFWTLGSLGGATWGSILPALAAMGAAVALLLGQARSLDLYALGAREARHLGCDTERLARRVVLAAALGTGAAVAVSGLISFVGLLAPHMVRLMAGSGHRLVLPASALLGAGLVLGADLVARLAVSPAELPIGVVTGLVGAPVFLWLILRNRAGGS